MTSTSSPSEPLLARLAAEAAGVPPALLLPRGVLAALGLELSAPATPPLGFLARCWCGDGWAEQLALGAFAAGLAPGGRGGAEATPTASAARWISPLAAPTLLDSPALHALLAASAFQGFVFLLLDEDARACALTTSPPAGALLALLEGAEGHIHSWASSPRSLLLESWCSSLVLSAWPWPREGEERAAPLIVPSLAGRHLWLSPSTREGLLGWATGWDHGLGSACARASRVGKLLTVPRLQWRVGAHRDLLHAWCSLAQKLGAKSSQ